MMKLEPGTHCPLLDRECIQFKCTLWCLLRGKNPQTNVELDEWACAISWLPILLIENAKEVREGAAATESFRNIMFRLASGETPDQIMKSEYKEFPRNGG